ncbi:MAG: ribosome maturation factor RimM [Alphaproteobacteria bacterium]
MGKDSQNRKICVGQFAGAHGVRGLVKLRSFTAEPEAIFDYAPLVSEDGARVFKLTLKSPSKDGFVAEVEGIADKDAADELRGDRLYVTRDILPKTAKGEYYEADLVGMLASDAEGKEYGKVLDIHDHGAGVFLEIGTSKKDSFMLPFKDAFVPEVDLNTGKLLIAVPEGWL